MSKEQLIDAIRTHNRSAKTEFLVSFNETALQNYLEHLKYMVTPRGPRSVWVRQAETAAISTRGQ